MVLSINMETEKDEMATLEMVLSMTAAVPMMVKHNSGRL